MGGGAEVRGGCEVRRDSGVRAVGGGGVRVRSMGGRRTTGGGAEVRARCEVRRESEVRAAGGEGKTGAEYGGEPGDGRRGGLDFCECPALAWENGGT